MCLARSVIKTILQFCKENSLPESFVAIQRECQVSLNTVESLEGFTADITAGRWDVVLPTVAQLKLPRNKLEDLYELVRPARSQAPCCGNYVQPYDCGLTIDVRSGSCINLHWLVTRRRWGW